MVKTHLWIAAALLAVLANDAQPYTFSVVTDQTGTGGFTAPALNNAGAIVLSASGGGSQRFDLWPRGEAAFPLLDTVGVFASFTTLSPIPHNSNGTVAFRGALDNGVEGIFTYGPAGLRTIADNTGQFSGFGAPPTVPALNDSGDVAFYADLRAGGNGIFLNDGLSTTTLASTVGSVYSGFSGLSVALNDRRDASMVALLPGGGQALLMSNAGAPALPVVDSSGPIQSFRNLLQMNNRGEIAFSAILDSGGQAVYRWGNSTLNPIMSVAAGTAVFNPSINEQGMISFLYTEGGARYAIYIYEPSTGVYRLLGAGDSFLGSVIVETGLPNPRGVFTSINSLNDLNELAFETSLADGRMLTVLASPVPEPSVYLLVGAGLLAVARAHRKKQKIAMRLS